MAYIDFNDESQPIGKRKQAYVRWAISKGTKLIDAQKQANEKFGFEKREGLLMLVTNYGRMHQYSFSVNEIFECYDLRKYKSHEYKVVYGNDVRLSEEEIADIIKEYKEMGWDVRFRVLVG